MRKAWIIACLLSSFIAQAQQKEISAAIRKLPQQQLLVTTFYSENKFNFFWFGKTELRSEIATFIQSAENLALTPADYDIRFPVNDRATNLIDSAEADVRFTSAVLHFFYDLKYGNTRPALRYDGIGFKPDFAALVKNSLPYIQSNRVEQLVSSLQPNAVHYANGLLFLQKLLHQPKDIVVTSGTLDLSNSMLVRKLRQFGIVGEVENLQQKDLISRVKQLQAVVGVAADGRIGKVTLQAINAPISRRIYELNTLVNYIRWFESQHNNTRLGLLNIPSATLFVYNGSSITLEARVIVGKPTTPTPTLSSIVNEVVLYPYWMVPKSIAVKELIPHIRRDISYLDRNGFQVVNSSGKVVNPYTINWWELGSGYFPYTLRQSTGCDNSLGLIKFNFPNPFSVYWHDTPVKNLFKLEDRYFSHGCMRLEKPVELARELLGWNRIAIDTLTEKGCLQNKSPIILPVQYTLAMYVVYSTAWFTGEGAIRFFPDVYNRLPEFKRKEGEAIVLK